MVEGSMPAPVPCAHSLRPFSASILCAHSLRPHGGRESGGAKRQPCTSRLEVAEPWLGRARFPPKKRRRVSAGVNGCVLVVSRRLVKEIGRASCRERLERRLAGA